MPRAAGAKEAEEEEGVIHINCMKSKGWWASSLHPVMLSLVSFLKNNNCLSSLLLPPSWKNAECTLRMSPRITRKRKMRSPYLQGKNKKAPSGLVNYQFTNELNKKIRLLPYQQPLPPRLREGDPHLNTNICHISQSEVRVTGLAFYFPAPPARNLKIEEP